MKKITKKSKKIKAALVLGAVLELAVPTVTLLQAHMVMAAEEEDDSWFTLTTTKSESEHYNGIKKTTKTTTVNGKSETEVSYTDVSGLALCDGIGEVAFEAAKAGEENPMAYAYAELGMEEHVTGVTMSLNNETDADITGLYMVPNNYEDWGENIFEEGLVLSADTAITTADTISYYPAYLFKIAIVTDDGKTTAFSDIDLSACEDAHNISFYFVSENGNYMFAYA